MGSRHVNWRWLAADAPHSLSLMVFHVVNADFVVCIVRVIPWTCVTIPSTRNQSSSVKCGTAWVTVLCDIVSALNKRPSLGLYFTLWQDITASWYSTARRASSSTLRGEQILLLGIHRAWGYSFSQARRTQCLRWNALITWTLTAVGSFSPES